MCDVPVAPGNSQGVVALKDVYKYPSSEFDERFAGEVDRKQGLITVAVNVVVVCDAPAIQSEVAKFQTEFKSVVESLWSQKLALKPACPVGRAAYRCRATVNLVTGSGHVTLHVTDTDAETSYAKGSPGAYVIYLKYTECAMKTQTAAKRDDVEDSWMFERNTAAHEFGHHLGLHHPKPQLFDASGGTKWDYGETWDEMNRMMGWGKEITDLEMAPWKRIAAKYGKEVFPSSVVEKCNAWTSVSNSDVP